MNIMDNMDKDPSKKTNVELAKDEGQVTLPGSEPVPVPDEADPPSGAPSEIVIIPRIINPVTVDYELEAILNSEEEDEDKHQHFFVDQIHFGRHRWPKPWCSAAAMIAFVVDVTNLTSFAGNIAQYGGVTYLIIYSIVMCFFAYPILYLEAIVGQYFQTGMIGVWGVCPIGRGLGVGMFYLNFLVIAILPLHTAWASIMASESLKSIHTGILPWVSCDNDWNTCDCLQAKRHEECKESIIVKHQEDDDRHRPASEYFLGNVLQLWKTKYNDPTIIKKVTENGNWTIAYGFNNGKDGLGQLIPRSCFLLLMTFVLIMFITLSKPKHMGYFYTFTTTVPFLILGLLFCRTVSLEGGYSGIKKYFATDISKIVDLSAWQVAFENAFFSLGCGCGLHIVLASFNPLTHNVKRDAIICVVIDTLTSFFATIVIYMFIGHLYTLRHLNLPDKFPGDDIVFITLAEAFSAVSGSSFFAAAFYIMVFFIGLDTQVVALHALAYSLYEEYRRKYPEQKVSKFHFLFCVWGLAFSVTLMCATRGGYWLFAFLRDYMFGYSSIVFTIFETIILCWIWGIEELCIATDTILGERPSMKMRIIWKYLLPISLISLFVYKNLVDEVVPLEVFDQKGPASTAHLGIVFQWIALCIITVYALYMCLEICLRHKVTCLQMLMLLISPEYEHAEIMENVKNAKRLHWKHYIFFRYPDEVEKGFSLQERIKKICIAVVIMIRKVKCKCPKRESAPRPVANPSKSSAKSIAKREKKSKKKAQTSANVDDVSLWSRLENDDLAAFSEKSKKRASTNSKKKKRKLGGESPPPGSSFKRKSALRKSKVNPEETRRIIKS